LADHATPLKAAFSQYVQAVATGTYPAPEHEYVMPPAEKRLFQDQLSPAKGGGAPKR
jgi:hypothetical protein